MVDIKKNPVYKAQSKTEAESWVATIGKSQYPSDELIIRRQGNSWHVYKG